MTDRDQLREQVARALLHHHCTLFPPSGAQHDMFFDQADAVLAVLPECEQVGYIRDDRSVFVAATGPLRGTEPPEGWVPVYIVREAEG